ncbi:hypothetical protein SOVF_184620 [Spinacia oleracea]|uniref:Pentatricopeptide repeat-containing protein At3g53700, chloroplastic-like n=1 Tax=Spinacia oleracea TaxID=3562 RepID=A0A9R0IZ89_SPIOL|nr:pentatricopeptide repeat-containing protein At3g53700, chloroplastic-like [Spinacia oleracea]XP_056699163.1 pentatricopeptide repeat-containing protein At3g53700, chloroplastic-like [Spinacia oleracea]KNA06057.1 hypothetical protein SOVF_184620 [Spinacia oleracea]
MGILKICQKLRYGGLNLSYSHCISLSPISYATNCTICSTGYTLINQSYKPKSSNYYFSSIISNGSNSNSQTFKNLLGSAECSRQFLRYNFSSKLFSSCCIDSSAKTVRNLAKNEASIGFIIDVIKGDSNDMEFRLNSIGLNQEKLILEILCSLNILKVPALRFFAWLKVAHSNYCKNANVCSLVVANCGLLGDSAGMLKLLKGFRDKQICLSEKAFGFLPILSTNIEADMISIAEVIEILNEVGGSCRNSGIHSLVEMLCSFNALDLAKYVIEISERKVSYYNVLMKYLCIRGEFENARNLFEEMRGVRCDPDCKTYNYFISSLCKQGSIDEAFSVFREMISKACSPNLITFEILIYFACRYGRSDQAVMFYDLMVSSNVKPRLSTHYAFIRGYFSSQRFKEAYRYVVDASAFDKCTAQGMYNVLASLHINDGNLFVAHNVLLEMLEKGLKPKHSIFLRATKCLRKIGKANFADNLNALYGSRSSG